MNDSQVRQFLTIVKYMNINKAAKELYISQPALSAALSRTEKELGVKLFYRDGNKLVLSKAGEILIEKFKNLENAHLELHQASDAIRDAGDSFLTFGFSISVTLFSTLYITGFLTSFDGKPIKKVFADRPQILGMLKSRQIDFAITYPPLEDNDICSANILCDDVVVVVSSKHHLAKCGQVKLKALENEAVSGLHKHHYFRMICDDYCLKNNINLQYVNEYDFPGYYQAIEKNKGSANYITLCQRTHFPELFGDGYKLLEIQDMKFEINTELSWITERKLQFYYIELVNHIKNNYASQYRYHSSFLNSLQKCF